MGQLEQMVVSGLEAQRSQLAAAARRLEQARRDYASTWDAGTWTGRASDAYAQRRTSLLDGLDAAAALVLDAAAQTTRALATLDDRG